MICPAPVSPSVEEQTALLQRHLASISKAIVRTRQETADPCQEREAGCTRAELHAIVSGTEDATNTLLTAYEIVDSLAGRLTTQARQFDRDVFMPDRPFT